VPSNPHNIWLVGQGWWEGPIPSPPLLLLLPPWLLLLLAARLLLLLRGGICCCLGCNGAAVPFDGRMKCGHGVGPSHYGTCSKGNDPSVTAPPPYGTGIVCICSVNAVGMAYQRQAGSAGGGSTCYSSSYCHTVSALPCSRSTRLLLVGRFGKSADSGNTLLTSTSVTLNVCNFDLPDRCTTVVAGTGR
jgi:hypothetical protein